MSNTPYDPSIDALVGIRLRSLRLSQGHSQATVARHLGVTSQQVQKYEAGTDRMAASRLYAASRLLHTPMEGFCRITFPRDPLVESFAGLDHALAEVLYQATVRPCLTPREAARMRPYVQEFERRAATLKAQLADLSYFLDARREP